MVCSTQSCALRVAGWCDPAPAAFTFGKKIFTQFFARVQQAKKAHDRMERHGLMDEAAHTGPGGKQKKESDVFARLSNREVEFYRDVFEQIDVDGSGEIDDKEVCALPCCCHP